MYPFLRFTGTPTPPYTQIMDAMRWSILSVVSLIGPLASTLTAAADSPRWKFDLKNSNSGILALEAIVVSPSLVLMFDRTCLFMQADVQGLTAFIRCQ